MRRITSTLTALVATLAIVLLPALDASAARPVKPPKPTPSPTATTTPPPPPTGLYVALGDSYAAGDGAGSYLSDIPSCYRSPLGYPGLIAKDSGLPLNLQACSGATTVDVLSRQLVDALGSATEVTITVGGNDIGFADVIGTCMGTSSTACYAAIDAAVMIAKGSLPGRLDTVFNAVRAGAPGATIVATNYPRLFNGKDCSLLTSFNSTELARLNAGADTLSDVIQAAAGRAGIRFADVRGPFVGHAVCDTTAWIHNASLWTSYESFHPNATGYRSGYTPTVWDTLGVSAQPSSGTLKVTTGGVTSSDTTRGHVKVKEARADRG